MIQQRWVGEDRKYIVCIDSYNEDVLKGRICSPSRDVEAFASLSQFLLKMEELLDEMHTPQAFTAPRRFPMILQPEERKPMLSPRKGQKTTFELKILFRQHTSWQGILVWRDQQAEHNFRSVLELVILMDSALRNLERSGCA